MACTVSFSRRTYMFCTKCGKDNAEDAVYCQKCGSMLEAEEETHVATREKDLESEDEIRIFSITPTTKFVKVGYGLAVLAAFLLAAVLSLFPQIPILVAVIVGLSLLLIPAYFHLKQKLVSYSLTDTRIEIDSGLVARTTQNVPLRRIQDVTVTSTIFQRMLGFGDLVIDNASEDGAKVILKNIDSPRKYADTVLRQMRRLDR